MATITNIETTTGTDMKKLLISAIALLLAGTASAETWLYVGAKLDRKAIGFVDLESKHCEWGVCSIWGAEITIDPKEQHDLSMMHFQFSCQEKQVKVLGASWFKKGDLVSSWDKGTKWMHVDPNSTADSFFSYACKETKVTDKDFVIRGSIFSEVATLKTALWQALNKR